MEIEFRINDLENKTLIRQDKPGLSETLQMNILRFPLNALFE